MPDYDQLLSKSLRNFEAAELLIENDIYSPSIHCSYYSCLQVILYLINYTLFDEWKSYNDELNKLIITPKKKESLHNQYISFIKNNINKTDIAVQRRFAADIGVLKKHRNDSDYTEKLISDTIANRSNSLARSINTQLLKHYKLWNQ